MEKSPHLALSSYSLEEFNSLDLSEVYLLNPILPMGGIGLIHGKGGAGKTQWCFSLMKSVVTGEPFLGRWPVRQGKVLYLQIDMPKNLFQERTRKAETELLGHESVHIVYSLYNLNILDPVHQREIAGLVKDFDPTLIVADTLRKLHIEDENDNAIPSQVYDAWKRTVGDDLATIILHHDRKSFFHEGRSVDGLESFRGARAWLDDSDLGVKIKKIGGKKSKKVKMDFSRLRCAPQDSMDLEFDEETLLLGPTEPATALEHARKLYGEGVHPEDIPKKLIDLGVCEKSRAYTAKSDLMSELVTVK